MGFLYRQCARSKQILEPVRDFRYVGRLGGWYDHVPPPIYNSYELGFRVPLIAISPYAKRVHISETQYEFGSLLKFVEQTFGTGSLDTTDGARELGRRHARFQQRPRSFVRIKRPVYSVDPSVPDSD